MRRHGHAQDAALQVDEDQRRGAGIQLKGISQLVAS
jgi:hypothetical protein